MDLYVGGATIIEVSRSLNFNNTNGNKIFDGLVTVDGSWNNSGNEDIEFWNGLTNNGLNFDPEPESITLVLTTSLLVVHLQ